MNERILRNYQIEIKARIRAAWDGGVRSVMCQMPSGTGKTVVAVNVIREELCPAQGRESVRVLVVAHRREILDQIRETLRRYGLERELGDGTIVVDSIQRLRANDYGREKELTSPTLVVVDEAHHAAAETYRVLWERWPEARFLGLTATPCRMRTEGFTRLFDRLVCSWQVKRFIEEGWLADFEYVVVNADSEMRARINGLKKRGADGDYQIKEMGGVLDNRASIEQLYESYARFAKGRQGIVYAINREHAEHIAAYYRERLQGDVRMATDGGATGDAELVALIDSGTSKTERRRIINEYREGRIQILVNCEIYTEGYDAPFVQFVQMARPTLSLSKYLQQAGRGLRPNKDGRKTVILDNVGLYYMFGLPSADRNWRRMFEDGQDLPARRMAGGQSAVMMMQNARVDNIDDGHDLEMTVLDRRAIESIEEGKAYICREGDGNSLRYMLMREDKCLTTQWFMNCSGYVDGIVCLQQDALLEKHYYDEDGKQVISLPCDSELLEDGIIRCNREIGITNYFDCRMNQWLPCKPNTYTFGDAHFIEETDGWHVRCERFNYIAFRKEDMGMICTPDGSSLVVMKDAKTGVSYVVLSGGRNVMAYLGMGSDGGLVVVNGKDRDAIFVWRQGRLQLMRKGGDMSETYDQWESQMKMVPLDRKAIHLVVGTDHNIQIFEREGLYGWMLNNEVICEAKFKDIIEFKYGKYVRVQLPGSDNTVVADYRGNILWKESHVYSITGDWANVLGDYREGCSIRVNLVSGAYIRMWKDRMVCGNFELVRSTARKSEYWCPKGYKTDSLALTITDMKDGVLYTHDHVSGMDVIAYENAPNVFVKVKQC